MDRKILLLILVVLVVVVVAGLLYWHSRAAKDPNDPKNS